MPTVPPSEQAASGRTAVRTLLAVLGVIGVTVAAYWPALQSGYVWNDPDYVTKPALRSVEGLWRIWFHVGATEQYYPFLHSAFWVEHQLWGDAALGYHAVNVLLHGASACLLALMLRRLSVAGAWLAALLFALHPVFVESVAWISEQKNTLSTFFYLLAALGFLRWRGTGRGAAGYWSATGMFLAAILSKSMAATLPAALLVVLWWRNGRIRWREDVVPLMPWFVLAAAGGLFTGWVERKYIGAEGSDFSYSLIERTLIAGRAVWFYLGKLAWPGKLIFIYPRWQIDAGAWWQYLFPIAALAVTAGLWAIQRKARGPLACWLLFVGALSPVLGFLNVYAFVFSFVADHWQYLAGLTAAAGAAAGLSRVWAKVTRASVVAGWAGSALLLIPMASVTWRECKNYHDAGTFYEAILVRNPACWMAHNNLGLILNQTGDLDGALVHFEEAVRLRPDYIEAHNNLGGVLFRKGRVDEAITNYREAIRLFPNYVAAHNNLSVALADQGQLGEAIAESQKVLTIRPGDPEALNDLGADLLHAGRPTEAEACLRELLKEHPDRADGWFNLGLVLERLQRPADAADAYRNALRVEPEHVEAHNNLGNLLQREGRTDEAIAEYRQAIRIRPGYAEGHDNLGHALAKLGRVDEALGEYRTSASAKPSFGKAFFDSGTLLIGQGRNQEGLADLKQAVRFDPGNPDAFNNLGVALCRLNRVAEAEPYFREAVRLKPDFKDAHKNLALVLQAAGRKDEARIHLDAAAGKAPAR